MRRVRYAVVGQGYIAQIAVLPALRLSQEIARPPVRKPRLLRAESPSLE